MANKRTPQTLKKRQRERDKQMKQQEKLAKRLDRKTQKRQASPDGDGLGYATGVVSDNGNPIEAHVPEAVKSPAPAPKSPPAPGPVPITKAS